MLRKLLGATIAVFVLASPALLISNVASAASGPSVTDEKPVKKPVKKAAKKPAKKSPVKHTTSTNNAGRNQ